VLFLVANVHALSARETKLSLRVKNGKVYTVNFAVQIYLPASRYV